MTYPIRSIRVGAVMLALCCGTVRAEWAGEASPALAEAATITALVAAAEWPSPSPTGLDAGHLAFVSELPDVGLWKFIASVRAMQTQDALLQLEGQLRILEVTSPPPTVVPLPGAAWFLLTGLLGLAGVRLGRRADRRPGRDMAPAMTAVSH